MENIPKLEKKFLNRTGALCYGLGHQMCLSPAVANGKWVHFSIHISKYVVSQNNKNDEERKADEISMKRETDGAASALRSGSGFF